jgi:hypothetical protein
MALASDEGTNRMPHCCSIFATGRPFSAGTTSATVASQMIKSDCERCTKAASDCLPKVGSASRTSIKTELSIAIATANEFKVFVGRHSRREPRAHTPSVNHLAREWLLLIYSMMQI